VGWLTDCIPKLVRRGRESAPEAQKRRAALLIGLAEGLVERAEAARPRRAPAA